MDSNEMKPAPGAGGAHVDPAAWPRTLLTVVDVLFIVSMIVLPLSWLLDPLRFAVGSVKVSVSWGFKPLLAPVVLLLVRLGIRSMVRGFPGLLGRPLFRKICLSMFSVYLAVGLPEVMLRVVGFRVDMAPVVFSLTDEEGQTEEQKGFADPELLWKFKPGEKYHGVMVNSLGYRDRDVDPEKKPGAIRVICMGDSVTAQGEPGYSGYLHQKLQDEPLTTHSWEAFNMAVYGYSSVQGLRVFQLQTRDLQPDFVTLYFGWNDHWLEMKTDSSRMAVQVHPLYGRIYNKLKEKRVFMLLYKLLGRGRGPERSREEAGLRVPPTEYQRVLGQFIEEIRNVGAVPIIITAARRDVIPTKEKHPDVAETMSYNETHDRYVALTREVAREHQVPVLDLAALFEGSEYDGLFMKDGIHFKQPGLKRIADELYRMMGEIIEKKDAVGHGAPWAGK